MELGVERGAFVDLICTSINVGARLEWGLGGVKAGGCSQGSFKPRPGKQSAPRGTAKLNMTCET
jgi:hypothetical protein